MLLAQDSVQRNSQVYFSSNKGNKKGSKNRAKFICWYNVQEKQIKMFLLDVYCIDKNIEEIMDAIMHSLKRTFPPGVEIILCGQCTDSGGGGTKAELAWNITRREVAHVHYLVGTCTLHNLQTGLRNAVEAVLGEGG